ncbi:insulin-like growth factor-binding protein 4 precursor [Corchorus olitorius]|uniref:Insulin-like growth factor-binding protein 4 n=1 Tax=Corchorus olitorius TaxID=93759 RepID=A0A1R3K8R1_9ROSI|nr:insulin-like growth factor-binding protein 4 precursor [Corchorus olitorius]
MGPPRIELLQQSCGGREFRWARRRKVGSGCCYEIETESKRGKGVACGVWSERCGSSDWFRRRGAEQGLSRVVVSHGEKKLLECRVTLNCSRRGLGDGRGGVRVAER